jgi:hypothetical protein
MTRAGEEGTATLQTLTIEATSLEYARGFYEALTGFEVELVQGDHGVYRVKLMLGSGDKDTLAALSAIERYVSARNDGPALIEMGGANYTLDPIPDTES